MNKEQWLEALRVLRVENCRIVVVDAGTLESLLNIMMAEREELEELRSYRKLDSINYATTRTDNYVKLSGVCRAVNPDSVHEYEVSCGKTLLIMEAEND